jgi:hypothetical protein
MKAGNYPGCLLEERCASIVSEEADFSTHMKNNQRIFLQNVCNYLTLYFIDGINNSSKVVINTCLLTVEFEQL